MIIKALWKPSKFFATPFLPISVYFLVPNVFILVNFRLSLRWCCLQWGEVLLFLFQDYFDGQTLLKYVGDGWFIYLCFYLWSDCIDLICIFSLPLTGYLCLPDRLSPPPINFYCSIVLVIPSLFFFFYPDGVWDFFKYFCYYIFYYYNDLLVTLCYFINYFLIILHPNTWCVGIFLYFLPCYSMYWCEVHCNFCFLCLVHPHISGGIWHE